MGIKSWIAPGVVAVALGGMVWVVAVTTVAHEGHDESPPSNRWLSDAPSDAERFERLESYLGGFSATMREVGDRYEMLHAALTLENYDLALYHWEHIEEAIEAGTMKRPARKPNSDLLFLDTQWAKANERFESENPSEAWEGFAIARHACMACHQAEGMEFLNNQPMFNDLRAPLAGR